MTRKFGVEIECLVPISYNDADVVDALCKAGVNCLYEFDSNGDHSTWVLTDDGSVDARNMNGIEVVSPILTNTADGFAQIELVCRVLNSIGARVRRCCGLHVHVYAKDLSVAHIKNVIKRYAQFEDQIDTWMPPSRRQSENEYCKTMKRKASTRLFENAQTVADIYRALSHDRFHKVNIGSHSCYGTLEFRHHSGTTNAEKIINWAKFCIGFLEASVPANDISRPVPTFPIGNARNRDKLRKVCEYITLNYNSGENAWTGYISRCSSIVNWNPTPSHSVSSCKHIKGDGILIDLNIDKSTLSRYIERINEYLADRGIRTLEYTGRANHIQVTDDVYNELRNLFFINVNTNVVANSHDLFANLDPNIISFYNERAEELAA